MGIKHIAAAMIAPAAIAGVALSSGTAASATTVHHRGTDKYHQWVTVRSGDTLSGIAHSHHMTWQALYATYPNRPRLHDPDLITMGEHLRLPADPKLRASQFTALVRRGLGPVWPAPAPTVTPAVTPAPEPAHQPVAQVPASQSSSGAAGSVSTSGESSFEQCVSLRESGNNPADPDGLFGLLPSTWASLGYSGSAGQASVAQQQEAFSQLYARDGTSPWAPYDGC